MKQFEKTMRTHDKIMAAAMMEFGQNGYAGASLNRICQTGIPKGLLYHNFKNKDTLYLACVEKSFSDLIAWLKAADIGCDLQKYIAIRLQFFRQNKNQAHLFFDAVLQPPATLREQINQLRAELDEWNSAIYKRLLATVTLRKGISVQDALDYFAMQQAMFNGYFASPAFRMCSFSEKIEAHETRLAQLLDFMLYGIAERGEK